LNSFFLQEASLADISYLFDEGTLVDFETQELIKLVCALFAETPQRANIINKLVAGHAHSP
jgi:centromere/kinetochore protein ZW10